ncbi:MAG: hypothetical protein FWE37_09230 [Spirochaetaceae bacterium]|nr:hypothetical protein [Spirochaetaceae bacterium]
MKKILILFLLLIAINAQGQGLPVPANATLASLFPDENLRRVVAEHLGPNAGLVGQRLSDVLARIEALTTGTLGVKNTSGIEYLVGLTKLDLFGNGLANINVNTLINLTYLDLGYNDLTSLDISNLINLTWLNVEQNLLTTLDIRNLAKLEGISINGTRLTQQNILGFHSGVTLFRFEYNHSPGEQ